MEHIRGIFCVWEVALKAIPHIGNERKRIVEEKALADLWLAIDEIQANSQS